jgi:hypothetical protein
MFSIFPWAALIEFLLCAFGLMTTNNRNVSFVPTWTNEFTATAIETAGEWPESGDMSGRLCTPL